jgi:DNA-binding transcriptional regulator GbsR (MarR family)
MDANVQQFVERLGLEARTEGLARTAARLFGYLVIEGGPCTSEELADALQVSRGNISMTTQYLETRGLIERTAVSGDARVYFRIAPDPYGNLVTASLDRRRRIRDSVAEARAALQESGNGERGAALERLTRMEAFYNLLIEAMEGLLIRWRTKSEPERPDEGARGREP